MWPACARRAHQCWLIYVPTATCDDSGACERIPTQAPPKPEFADINLAANPTTAAAAERYSDSDSVFVVSGASRGIGVTIAEHLLKRSAGKVICLGRSCEASTDVARLSSLYSGRVIPMNADLSNPESVHDVAASIDAASHGRVDLLFNVAGVLGDGKADPGPERTARHIDPAWMRHSFVPPLWSTTLQSFLPQFRCWR